MFSFFAYNAAYCCLLVPRLTVVNLKEPSVLAKIHSTNHDQRHDQPQHDYLTLHMRLAM